MGDASNNFEGLQGQPNDGHLDGDGNNSPSRAEFEHKKRKAERDREEYLVSMKHFWQKELAKIDGIDFNNLKHPLPLARIKKIMKSDEDVRMISQEAPILFAKACELFVLDLTIRAWSHTDQNNRRTLQRSDVAEAIASSEMFDFLIDIVPREPENLAGNNYQETTAESMLRNFQNNQLGGSSGLNLAQNLSALRGAGADANSLLEAQAQAMRNRAVGMPSVRPGENGEKADDNNQGVSNDGLLRRPIVDPLNLQAYRGAQPGATPGSFLQGQPGQPFSTGANPNINNLTALSLQHQQLLRLQQQQQAVANQNRRTAAAAAASAANGGNLSELQSGLQQSAQAAVQVAAQAAQAQRAQQAAQQLLQRRLGLQPGQQPVQTPQQQNQTQRTQHQQLAAALQQQLQQQLQQSSGQQGIQFSYQTPNAAQAQALLAHAQQAQQAQQQAQNQMQNHPQHGLQQHLGVAAAAAAPQVHAAQPTQSHPAENDQDEEDDDDDDDDDDENDEM